MSSPTRKIIFLSGNHTASHDTAAQFICENFPFSMHLKLSQPLKNAVHALYGKSCPHNAYESTREKPHHDFLGNSPSLVYQQMSDWIKNHQGADFLAHIICKTIENFGSKHLFVISELEHPEQAQPFIDLVGAENILHLKLQQNELEMPEEAIVNIDLPNVRTHQIQHSDLRHHHLKSRIYHYVNYWMEDRDGLKVTRTPQVA